MFLSYTAKSYWIQVEIDSVHDEFVFLLVTSSWDHDVLLYQVKVSYLYIYLPTDFQLDGKNEIDEWREF